MTNPTSSHEHVQAASKRSERTCAGCGKHVPAEESVRLVLDPSTGEIAVDIASSAFGRGAHVHPTDECLGRAVRGGLSRVFRSKVTADASSVRELLTSAADRRIEGLLTGARRAGQLVWGADAVVEALSAKRVSLILVAADAAAATRIAEVEKAVAAGMALVVGTKARLGALLGKDEIALVGVSHDGVAAAMRQTHRLAASFRSAMHGIDLLQNTKCDLTSSGPSGGRQQAGSEQAWSPPEVR